jgi:signal transduction histidine kinase
MAASTALASAVDIESFMREYFGAWHGTDEDRILSYYADDATVQIPGILMQGRAALRAQFVRPFITAFPGNRHVLKNWIFGQNVVVVEWTFEAVHQGPFEGRAATHARVQAPGCGVYEYDPVKRQITGARIYLDVPTLLTQIIEHGDARSRAEESATGAMDISATPIEHQDLAAALSALTASIAHEVNQPLSGIITNASTCLRMLDAMPPDVAGARETARRTIRDGNRAADVVTRLRALFSKREFTLESLDLNEAAREVIALSANDFQRRCIVLRSELGADLPTVTGDRIQLQQVILNLIRNASEAMADVQDRPRQLLISTGQEQYGDHVRLSVRDTGVGLSPQSLDALFDAFYTTKNGGMGIGLFISRSIIERHHGRLWAEPNEGAPGATFAFSIPCTAATHTNV